MNDFLTTIKQSKKKCVAVVGGVLLLLSIFLCCFMYIAFFAEGNFLQASDAAGADLYYHANRILSIADGWKGGSFWVRVYPNVLNGYGYASPLFYPDLFLYAPAFLVFLGMPLPLAYTIFCTLIFFCSGLFYYLFGKAVFKRISYALLSACLFMTGHFTFVTVVYMGGIGQALAAVFAPVLLLGLYNMLREDFSKPWILLLAMLGFTFSHTLSLFLYGLFLIVVVLCNCKKLLVNPRWWIKAGSIFGVYLLLTAGYFLPLLEQMASTKFMQSVPWAYPSQYAYYSDPGKHMFFYGNPFTRSGTVRYTIGILAVVGLCFRVFVRKTEENRLRVKWIDRMIILVAVLMLCCTALFPWKLLDNTFLKVIQFPFRLLMISAMLIPLCLTLIVRELFEGNCRIIKLPRRALVIGCAIAVGIFALYDVVFLPDGKTLANDPVAIRNYIGTGEWLPLYEDIEDIGSYREIVQEDSLYASDGSAVAYQRSENTVCFVFAGDADTYTLPLIYYKGYAAVIETDHGMQSLSVSPDSYGRVTVSSDAAGEITVYYAGTILQGISCGISAVSLAACVGVAVYFGYKRKKA